MAKVTETMWAVGYGRDLYDDSPEGLGMGLVVGGGFVPLTGLLPREEAERRLEELRAEEPYTPEGCGPYVLVPEDDDEGREPDEDPGGDPDDGTLGYDYFGPSWATREI